MSNVISHIIVLCTIFLWPLATESIRYWQIETKLEVKVRKNTPPYQAFKQINKLQALTKANEIQTTRTQSLSAENLLSQDIQLERKLVLLEPIEIKKMEPVSIRGQDVVRTEPLDLSWINSLPLRQRILLEKAQSKYDIFSDLAKEQTQTKLSAIEKEYAIQVAKSSYGYNLKGAWEIAGGLGMTADHKVSIQRIVEGIPKEVGEVSLRDGTYNIHVDALYGNLIAKMMDPSGKVLGEGQFKLEQDLVTAEKAPKLIIQPANPYFTGRGRNIYEQSPQAATPKDMSARVFNGEGALENTDKGFRMAGINKGSITVGEFAAPGFMTTNMILRSGEEFDAQVLPVGMVKALKEMVSEQLRYDLNHPDLPIIWGQVLFDGKPLPGVQIEIEGYPSVKPVYFDVISLPDVGLKETTANGLFAFVGAPEGMQALMAKRDGQYYSHSLVVVESGRVSVTKLQSSLKTNQVPLRVFDGFTGSPQKAYIEMQSVETPITITESGWTGVLLPDLVRLSLMRVSPSAHYIPALYTYSDHQDYIHVPLILEEWLINILRPKWDIIDSDLATAIGFVPTEDFEVFLAGYSDFSVQNITYFDAQGKVTEHGVSGGGFIINNIPAGPHEIVVFGKSSQKISSRLVPMEAGGVSVVSFQEH